MTSVAANKTVRELIRVTGEYFAGKGIDSAKLNAERLLADVLGVSRIELFMQFDRPVLGDELAAYRLVVKRALLLLRARVRRAIERGEVTSDALERFPQLLVAPALMALIWQSLFAPFEPLDVSAMLRTHVDLLFAALEGRQA